MTIPIGQINSIARPSTTPLSQTSNVLPEINTGLKTNTDVVSIEVLNEDKKMIEYSTHQLGIRCVMNNHFNLLYGGKMQVVITDGNSNHQCTVELTGQTKNKIVQLITQ